MSIAGVWVGTWRQSWPSADVARPLRFLLAQHAWWSVRGSVSFGPGEAGPRLHVRGTCFLGDLSISLEPHQEMPSVPSIGAHQNPSAHFPDRFTGRAHEKHGLSGTWRTLTFWMVGKRRRTVPVVLAEGTWSLQRIASSDRL